MNPRTLLLPLAASAALGLAACGSDSKDTAGAKPISNAQAVTEIGIVRRQLTRALGSYRTGDKTAAADLVANAYLEHFELVEAPLEKVDAELNERLEEELSADIRNKMKAGAPLNEIEALVTTAKRDLSAAVAKLQ